MLSCFLSFRNLYENLQTCYENKVFMAKQKKDIVYRFKQIFNERFKTRDWFTYSDVMADYLKADNRDNESVEKMVYLIVNM